MIRIFGVFCFVVAVGMMAGSCAQYKSSEDRDAAPVQKLGASSIDWGGSRETKFNDVYVGDEFEQANENAGNDSASNVKIGK